MNPMTRVLIVDDEFPIRYLVEHALRRKGFEVTSAKDGPSGLKIAAAYQPDIIVLDVMMPDMDGFDVCARLKSRPETADIPVIFLTALMDREYKQRAFKAGAEDYLVKPFQADELLAHVASVLRKTGRLGELDAAAARPQLITFFSPKGGVGTTTLAIQISEALAIHQDHQIALIDMALPIGGIGPLLNLAEGHHIVKLLRHSPNEINPLLVKQYLQPHRRNLHVIAAPGRIKAERSPDGQSLAAVCQALFALGYQVIIDLGSTITPLALTALRHSNVIFTVTSGQANANRALNAFIDAVPTLGLESSRILPVINELFGPNEDTGDLVRVPTARIPHASANSRTKLWLRDQGMQKLVSILV
jgi:pilus assembly protein CpaE